MFKFENIVNWLTPNKHKCFVLDGDTIIVYGGIANLMKRTVRLVGIDCEESSASVKFGRTPTENGERAKTFMIKLLEGKYVKMDSDNLATTDKYGRMLAYVYMQNDTVFGQDVAELLLENGLARVYNYRSYGFDKMSRYIELEKTARDKKIGVWGIEKTEIPAVIK